MDYTKFDIQGLKIELGIRKKGSPLWNAAMKELERRYQQPPDISNETAIVEILTALQGQ